MSRSLRIFFAARPILAAFVAVLIVVAARGFYEWEKGVLTDPIGRPSATRANSFLVMDVASHCRTAGELARRLGPAPIRVRRDGGFFVGYVCRDGKAVVVRTDLGGVVTTRPAVAPILRENGPGLLP